MSTLSKTDSSAGTSRSLALKGLLLDSTYQVVDNKVFRVLIVMALIPILLTFLVGVHEESISLLFGLKEWGYPEWIHMLGDDPRSALLEIYIGVVVDFLGGSIGMMVCIAATAFFVPRMLEKGASDLVFTKPIPRWLQYLARYVTGLLFVAFLGLFLTVFSYLGLRVVSGYHYPAILWSCLSLVYGFALVHGVSMLIGLLTRSTSAAMILGIMFFMGNGCIHGLWQSSDQARSDPLIQAMLESSLEQADEESSDEYPEVVAPALEEAPEEVEEAVDQATEDLDATTEELSVEVGDDESMEDPEEGFNWKGFVDITGMVLDGLHYPLPKTSEAPLLVLHIQESLFPSGRLETRAQMIQGGGRRSGDEGQQSRDSEGWFETQFGFGAEELRYNAWFSLLSSLAFTLAVLGFGMWRLSKIDF